MAESRCVAPCQKGTFLALTIACVTPLLKSLTTPRGYQGKNFNLAFTAPKTESQPSLHHYCLSFWEELMGYAIEQTPLLDSSTNRRYGINTYE
jgi:hypothetical protein